MLSDGCFPLHKGGLNTAGAVNSRLKGRLYIAALLPYFANRKQNYRMVSVSAG